MRLARLIAALGVLIGLCMAPAQAAWKRASSPHFIVYSDGAEGELKSFAENLERFDYLLRLMTKANGPDESAPVRVYLMSTAERVQAIAGMKNIGGYYTLSPHYAYAVATREQTGSGPRENRAQETLFHEYAHHFMLHYFTNAYPAWYIEAFAEYYSTVTFGRGTVDVGKVPIDDIYALSQGIYPLKDLFSKQPEFDRPEQTAGYYATAWLLLHFVQTNPARNQEMMRYLTAVAEGKPDIDTNAFFAGGLAALQKEISAYEQRGTLYREMKLSVPAVAVTLTPLPADENALVYQQIALLGGAEGEEAKALAANVEAATAKFPDSAYAWSLKAEANRMAGDDDAALAAAARAVALDPKASIALGVAARILLQRAEASRTPADMEKARAMIVDANLADTGDPLPLLLYYRYHMLQGRRPPQLAIDGLTRAFTLLPQASDIRFTLAQAMANDRQFAVAANLLAPMAGDPHGGKAAENARRLRETFLTAAKTGKLESSVTIEAD